MEAIALPPAPASPVDANGAPRFGAYAGDLSDASLRTLDGPWRRGALYRFTHGKSWRWGMVADDRLMAAFALVDVGYAANAFVFVVDLAERRVLADRSALGLAVRVRVGDAPNAGSDARFDGGGMRIRISRPRDATAYRVGVRGGDIDIDIELDAREAPPGLVLIAPIPQGMVNVTQKTAGLAARGTVRAGGTTHELARGVGGFDYTNGLMARRTAWRWAYAAGRADRDLAIGLNLVEGFNDAGAASENVAWRERDVAPLGPVRFAFDRSAPLDPWRISSDDGAVDLTFRPTHVHREDRDLVVARSRFVQAAGTFAGSLRVFDGVVPVSDLAGVTEDQDVLW